jgi:hypothetical protein
MLCGPGQPVDYENFRARDREAEIAKIRARQVERQQMHRIYRRRRAIAVSLLLVPVAALAVAGAWPRGHAAKRSRAPETTAVQATTAPVGPARFPEPAEVRATHLNMYFAQQPGVLDQVIRAANPTTGLTAVVVDVKNEDGHVAFTEGVPKLARETGAAGDYYDPYFLTKRLHNAGLYVIGRVVVFEDPILGGARKDRAIRTTDGGVWHNDIGLAWLNEYDERNWKYAVDIARAAGRQGFDEIQFDYVRFPTDGHVQNAVWPHRRDEPMSRTIERFLRSAVDTLHRDNLRVSADLFGLAATTDLHIGQDPRLLRNVLDAISPMAYPCAYRPGSYNIADPCSSAADTISATLADWQRVLTGGTVKLRPWLQAYNWAGVTYGRSRVEGQVSRTREMTPSGFMLWNAASQYDGSLLTFPPATPST